MNLDTENERNVSGVSTESNNNISSPLRTVGTPKKHQIRKRSFKKRGRVSRPDDDQHEGKMRLKK